jgi:hypothetical protein
MNNDAFQMKFRYEPDHDYCKLQLKQTRTFFGKKILECKNFESEKFVKNGRSSSIHNLSPLTLASRRWWVIQFLR